jgi:hypothetical protein
MNTLKRLKILIAILALILPGLARGICYYRGLPTVRPEIQNPDYAGNTIPQPPIAIVASEEAEIVPDKVVVLDNYHSNNFDPSEVETFVAALTERGGIVEYDYGTLAARLKYACAYIVFSPNSVFSTEELIAVKSFVERGGRLVIFTDPTRGLTSFDWFTGMTINKPDVNAANALLSPFDLSINNDYLYNLLKNEGNFRNVLFETFGSNTLTIGMKQVAFYGAHSVKTRNGTALILGDENTYSSLTDAGENLPVAALSPNGNALAVGDFSFMIPPYNQVSENTLLVQRIANFTLGGKVTHTLADFPFIFDKSVSAWATGELKIRVEVLGPIAHLQAALRTANISLKVVDEPVAQGDKLVIGLLAPSDGLKPFVAPFHIDLTEMSTITIPGFGSIDRKGIGVLLFSAGQKGNTLVMLTNALEDLPTFIDLLSNSDLSSCVIQENVGVCAVGSGGGFYPPIYFGTPTPIP